MRNNIIILFFFLVSALSYADAGYGYRFSVKTTLKNSEITEGYIYVYSWEKYEGFGNLKKFLIKNVPNNELKIYPYVSTVSNQFANLDFVLESSNSTININEIEDIREKDFLSFEGGSVRHKELSEKQFNLIKVGNYFSHAINADNLSEYCHLLFFNWNEPINKKLVNTIYTKLELKKKELENNLEGNNGTLFYNYFNQLKEDLIDKNVLLIMYCESC